MEDVSEGINFSNLAVLLRILTVVASSVDVGILIEALEKIGIGVWSYFGNEGGRPVAALNSFLDLLKIQVQLVPRDCDRLETARNCLLEAYRQCRALGQA